MKIKELEFKEMIFEEMISKRKRVCCKQMLFLLEFVIQ